MRTILNYEIVSEADTVKLAQKVNLHILNGWQPIGGVMIGQSPERKENIAALTVEGQMCHQALVRYKED